MGKATKATAKNRPLVLKLGSDKPAKHVVFGPNWTPPRKRRPPARARFRGVGMEITRDRLVELALTSDARYLLAGQSSVLAAETLIALRLTELGWGRAIEFVDNDEGPTLACRWPWRRWRSPEPEPAMISWRAPDHHEGRTDEDGSAL